MGEVREQPSRSASPAGGTTKQRLERLIAGALFTVVYQPIVDLGSGRVVACEALARPAAESGFDNPGELIGAASDERMAWEVEAALRAASLAGVREFEANVSVFVNCSPDVFTDARFADALGLEVRTAGVDPSRVVIEVTERTHEGRETEMSAQVARLKARGFAVAIDDVGAGTSGLSRLVNLRPEWLKLDRGLIHDIHTDEFRKNLVRFFGHFARLSGVRVIAEGVETFDDLAAVASLGVRYSQGYHFAKPGTPATVLSQEQAGAIAASCAEANWALPEAVGRAGLRRLIQPARSAQGALFASEAAGELMRTPSIEGLAVFDGRRVLGWISRERVLAAARRGPKTLLSACVRPTRSVVSPDMSLSEAVELLCMRDDEALGDPLVVIDDGKLAGVVRARDLLRAASRQGDRATCATMLVGFAGRAAADQFIAELLSRPTARAGGGAPIDAVIVDVQGMADFNAAYGYELGDVVIQALAESVREVHGATRPGVFSAHLGDDRFIVVGPGVSDLCDLHAMEKAFGERTTRLLLGNDGQNAHRPAAAEGTESVLRAGRDTLRLRFLLIHDVVARIRSPREIPAIERQLREKLAGHGPVERVGRAVLVRDDRLHSAYRKSA
jgi:EAL domain-containing protein (putative c-di-GMP-specific phosphodiesterase class I)/GGDEF domain-containing protein